MQYALKPFSLKNFADITDRKLRERIAEQKLIRLFFGEAPEGNFVEVGANEVDVHDVASRGVRLDGTAC